ncbi:glutathione S-transferase family protein [Dyella silvatica]|uniref:glutathione S-transferase family protein n=1 Tax=Dyella silvatica TaxID=2992128 RepID=UPI002253EC61|nr:glutathione S-transferase family protein [Dyella silvatica]
MYTLYYSPGTASMVVHQALLEIGAPYQLVDIDFDAGAQRNPDYLKLNPQGKVPTLILDGQPRSESTALLMMLAERHPEAGLAPLPGSPERDVWLQWMVYLSNTLASAYRLWFYPKDLGAPEHSPAQREALQQKIHAVWDNLQAHLAAHGPYVVGKNLSAADLLLTMYMRWSRNMPRPATEWPALKHLADLVRARPSWSKLCELEDLSAW